jgi:hypothetical protein
MIRVEIDECRPPALGKSVLCSGRTRTQKMSSPKNRFEAKAVLAGIAAMVVKRVVGR